MFGNKPFDVDEADNIIIDSVLYASTHDFYELIFKRILDNLLYTENDMDKYNAHKHKHHSQSRILSNREYKYKYVIAPSITPKKQKKSGKGLSHVMTLNVRHTLGLCTLGSQRANESPMIDASHRTTMLMTTRCCR